MSFDVLAELQAIRERVEILEEANRLRSFSDPLPPRFVSFQELSEYSGLSVGVLKFRAVQFGLYDPDASPRGRGRKAGIPWDLAGDLLRRILRGPRYEATMRRVLAGRTREGVNAGKE